MLWIKMASDSPKEKESAVKSNKNTNRTEAQDPQKEEEKSKSAEKIKAGKKTLRKPGTKLLLDLPFTIKPPLLEPTGEKQLLEQFNTLFEKYPELKLPKFTSKKAVPSPAEKAAIKKGKAYRTELIIGMNAVIRGVEKNNVAAVLTSQPARLPISVEHLVPLCASRNCPCLCTNSLSEKVASKFNVTSLAALGFKPTTLNPSSIFFSLVTMICKLSPKPEEVHKSLFSNKVSSITQAADSDPKQKPQKPPPASTPVEVGPTLTSLYIRKSIPVTRREDANFLSFTPMNVTEVSEGFFPDRPYDHIMATSIQVKENKAQDGKAPILRNLAPTDNSQKSLLIPPKIASVVQQNKGKKRKAKQT